MDRIIDANVTIEDEDQTLRPQKLTDYVGQEQIKEKLKSEPVKNEKKVGRNSLCPCGSGKKYKQCCGK